MASRCTFLTPDKCLSVSVISWISHAILEISNDSSTFALFAIGIAWEIVKIDVLRSDNVFRTEESVPLSFFNIRERTAFLSVVSSALS